MQGSSPVLQEGTQRLYSQIDNHIRSTRTIGALCKRKCNATREQLPSQSIAFMRVRALV